MLITKSETKTVVFRLKPNRFQNNRTEPILSQWLHFISLRPSENYSQKLTETMKWSRSTVTTHIVVAWNYRLQIALDRRFVVLRSVIALQCCPSSVLSKPRLQEPVGPTAEWNPLLLAGSSQTLYQTVHINIAQKHNFPIIYVILCVYVLPSVLRWATGRESRIYKTSATVIPDGHPVRPEVKPGKMDPLNKNSCCCSTMCACMASTKKLSTNIAVVQKVLAMSDWLHAAVTAILSSHLWQLGSNRHIKRDHISLCEGASQQTPHCTPIINLFGQSMSKKLTIQQLHKRHLTSGLTELFSCLPMTHQKCCTSDVTRVGWGGGIHLRHQHQCGPKGSQISPYSNCT